MKLFHVMLILAAFMASGCKDENNSNVNNVNNINNINNNDGGTDDIDNTDADADGGIDADTDAEPPECVPGLTECSDCVDNDGNGLIDGFDPTCVSPDDRSEGDFTTEIPGDGTNTDWLDCWFDGNSGGGDDGCRVHICCMLTDCPVELQAHYVPEECATDLTTDCVDNCLEYVVPGCDCFGCCSICVGSECHDIFIGTPVNFPDCTLERFDDPQYCAPCTLNENCANPCDPQNCELCPGMTVDDLPPECNQTSTCGEGVQECNLSTECPATYYCAVGCCLAYVQ
ncbi:hypothetical protein KKC22_09765 [Myxococcota bacterium]|nr:hypothetical protein [Myxococcota bacterium]